MNRRPAIGSGEHGVIGGNGGISESDEDHLDPFDHPVLRVGHLDHPRLTERLAHSPGLTVAADHGDEGRLAGAGEEKVVTAGREGQQGERYAYSRPLPRPAGLSRPRPQIGRFRPTVARRWRHAVDTHRPGLF